MGKSSGKKKKAPEETGAAVRPDAAGLPHTTDTSGPRNAIYYVAASVSLLTFLVYLKALRNDFVNWDDPLYVLENPHIRSLNPAFFKWAFFDFYAANWHPLTWISHALDYAIWGLNPLGHHLTNIILHAINTFLAAVLVMKLVETGRGAMAAPGPSIFPDDRAVLVAGAAAGLLFGLHPIHVESVAWVTERKDLLCALFFLLSINSYLSYKPSTSYKAYVLCLGFFVLALLSKPMAVSLPVVLLILDWHPIGRISSLRSFREAVLEKLPFIALSLVSSVLTVMAQKAGQAMELMEYVPLTSRLIVAVRSLIAYLVNMSWPLNLLPFYPYPRNVSLLSPESLGAIMLALGITAACVALARRRQFFLAAWGYYVVTLLPVLGIIQVGGQAMADRYAYLPSMGPFLLMGLGTAWILTRVKERGPVFGPVAIAAAVLLAGLLSLLTFKQIGIWDSSVDLWTYAIEKKPHDAAEAYKNRGLYFQESGQLDRAVSDYSKAIETDPFNYHAYNNRGVVFTKLGELDRAFADLDRAISLKPTYGNAYINKGLALDMAGRPEKAVAEYDKVISLNPSDYSVYNYRGIAFDKLGRPEKAIADYDTAVRLNPDFYGTYKNRAAALMNAGQYDKAMADYDRAVALNPSDYRIFISAGASFGQRGLFDRAIECFNRVIAANPRDHEAYNDRGFTHFLAKQYDKALQDFDRAIELNGNNALAYDNRGTLYRALGKREAALADFQKACGLGDQRGCTLLKQDGR